ncbi:hypothetical protein CEXT_35981 [Caerostris extrusa]|uniref:Uncharacterized protein n=1 Tax=Caerostris extrusa TaxID=172846 RepID=A0AAV4MF61_CAEEX|nr:hypothetical protein CEXT_35981 [Caerostris extrusa]
MLADKRGLRSDELLAREGFGWGCPGEIVTARPLVVPPPIRARQRTYLIRPIIVPFGSREKLVQTFMEVFFGLACDYEVMRPCNPGASFRVRTPRLLEERGGTRALQILILMGVHAYP